jgi:deazaflavin-dependent oxidoreductase (nitroreductase family)
METSDAAPLRYLAPSRADALFNRLVRTLATLGVGFYGARNLAVRGRRTGAWQVVPVNLLEHQGGRFLVAPRGVTQWVRNLRAAGGGELRLGRRTESFRAKELADAEKPPLLRAYLERWAFEVRAFFPQVGKSPTEAELRGVAARYPVFRLDT